ncbi:hypothetical protein COS54_00730 [Candidatus Shapirobacteria bacterium CG03_land_8_20_14_0_80_39_12]|uniref:Uncharacterized protein n=1 Tax=Candidatus Shapirobacteria bacterium CG03_land_8_20_14_0_80_39_12 TaxID=1974879 RepID=A0A2M7BES9_9BACT|nr:MAG: hypothetical protein COS54_00730 [Candidatus Shapirobacteria bacterium CG03_land_8_20_14_0_80_39_12]
MIKKLLMILLVFAFIGGILFLLYVGKNKMHAPSISLPVPISQPTSVPEASPSATSNGSIVEMENDLKLIGNDLQKIKEDTRLNPPAFLFDLGLTK